jgi:hypothetical protein
MKLILLSIILGTVTCCLAEPISPKKAKDHIGESASVCGLVEQVSVSKKVHTSERHRTEPVEGLEGR